MTDQNRGPWRKGEFTRLFLDLNYPALSEFSEWAFLPGMLFNAKEKWWGDKGRRDKPHEGIDLCLYNDTKTSLRILPQGLHVPVIADGVVVHILEDFLGTTVIIAHESAQTGQKYDYCTIYGHTRPAQEIRVGTAVRKDESMGTIAPARPSATAPSHLHISLGWKTHRLDWNKLDWSNMTSPEIMLLFDPLDLIGAEHCTVIDNAALACTTLSGYRK